MSFFKVSGFGLDNFRYILRDSFFHVAFVNNIKWMFLYVLFPTRAGGLVLAGDWPDKLQRQVWDLIPLDVDGNPLYLENCQWLTKTLLTN